jgi:putative glycerol-1-phosphate prenyltransferase
MAGEMLGLQSIYLDAVAARKRNQRENDCFCSEIGQCSAYRGRGINSSQKALNALEAGADMIVIGNALEKKTIAKRDLRQGLRVESKHRDKKIEKASATR